MPGGFIVAAASASAPVTDSRYNRRLSKAVYIYAPRDAERRGSPPVLRRVVTVHHEPKETEMAHRTARLCARLLRLHFDRFGQDAVFGRGSLRADVWVLPDEPTHAGNLGGETWGDQVYLVPGAREKAASGKSLEWVRTVTHEWGHLTLPAARGFTEPESDASGYLGERLYLKWLREDQRKSAAQNTTAADDGVSAADLELYHLRQTAPLLERFAQAGPETKTLDGTDTAAMDMYVGAVLAADESFGSMMTGRALFSILDVRPRDFLHALREVVTAAPRATVRLPAWIPLARAAYEIRPGPDGGSGSVALADRPPLAVRPNGAQTPLNVRVPGWKWVRAADGDLRAITLRRHSSSDAARTRDGS